jgi:glycyl-tRNA synthetase
MEMQFFVKPGDDAEWFERWRGLRMAWHQELGLNPDKLRWHPHVESELAHYARAAYDIEYEFPFGWSEIEGIHNRGDFDLTNHQTVSGKKLEYFRSSVQHPLPPQRGGDLGGADRIALTLLVDAFREEQVEGETRTVLGFHPSIAPIKAAVLPLVNKDAMPEMATGLFNDIRKKFACFYDDGGAIGRRYRRMDEVGTPFCVTVDGQTADDRTVTVRHRDSMAQDRIGIDAVAAYLSERLT